MQDDKSNNYNILFSERAWLAIGKLKIFVFLQG